MIRLIKGDSAVVLATLPSARSMRLYATPYGLGKEPDPRALLESWLG